MPPLLVPRDAGKILGVTTARVQQLEKEGRLPAIRDSAGRRLFRKADVLRLAKERQRQTERQAAVARTAVPER